MMNTLFRRGLDVDSKNGLCFTFYFWHGLKIIFFYMEPYKKNIVALVILS